MNLKSDLKYIVFGITFSTWVVSLLAVYLPMSRWVTPTFPVNVDNTVLTAFLATTILSSMSSLYIGLGMLGIKSKVKRKISEKAV